jgi:hypothetical protein
MLFVLDISYLTYFFYLPRTLCFLVSLVLVYYIFQEGKQIISLHNKIKGEKLLKTALSQLDNDYVLIFNVSFRIKYHKSSIKSIVITKNCIYNIDAVYESGILALNNKNKLLFYDKNHNKKENRKLFSKLEKDQENLEILLKDFLPENKMPEIKNVITYTNADCVFNEEKSKFPVIKYNNLMDYITSNGAGPGDENKYNLDDQENIARIIINQDENFHFKRYT